MVVRPGEGRFSPPKSPPRPQRRLHDFDFPIGSWGIYRILRRFNLTSSAESEAPASSQSSTITFERQLSPAEETSHPTKSFAGDRDFKKVKGRGAEKAGTGRSSSFIAAAAEDPARDSRPWNLRSQKAVCNAPIENSCPQMEGAKVRSDRSEEGPRQKFSFSLSGKEIEQDFQALIGRTAPRWPMKRPRPFQRHLDSIFPGLWLGDITPEKYKVDGKKSSF